MAAKEQLFSLLGELQVDSYWYERNRAAICIAVEPLMLVLMLFLALLTMGSRG